jgi:hypothetical protein
MKSVPNIVLKRIQNATFVPTEFVGEYQLGLGPLTNNGADFVGWEKIPDAFRGGFSCLTNDTLAAYPKDWPEIEVFSVFPHILCLSSLD